MSATLTLALLRSSLLRDSHRSYSLILECSEGIPSWVHASRQTLAFGLVQILTAAGAQTATGDPAFGEGGYREDHLVTDVRFEVDLSHPHLEAVRLTIVLLQQIRRREEKRDIDIDLALYGIQAPAAILGHRTHHATPHDQLARPRPAGVQNNVEGLFIRERKSLKEVIVRLDPPLDSQRLSTLQVEQIEFEHSRKSYPKPWGESTRGEVRKGPRTSLSEDEPLMLGKEKGDFGRSVFVRIGGVDRIALLRFRKQLANRSILGFSRIGGPDYRTKLFNRIFGL